ncbi:MAG: type I restriction-modification enzyme R subunit C-terminal domain-containing protein [Methanocorpusculum sp.]|uniref:type I restriction endonuclease subunit R n=1 Tax=Methanocorpusculum sp. TaxID=2058474 RepID=UPI002B1F0A7D|nr:DEAD/DEAH box helicase family protein [Methanocorpusculum sp.]MEA5087106.1 type I restriction-modification enzyme R subunit C-terminal domain-containing protein [Methanocorpusculum sp.]
MHPEDKARIIIDEKLEASGWVIQDYKREFNPRAALGVVVRDFSTETGPADYMMFIAGEPVGIIEAKEDAKGEKITTVEEQSKRYLRSNLKGLSKDNRRFTYEATSVLIRFTDHVDVNARSREVFSFHRPETLSALIQNGEKTLRNTMRDFPPFDSAGFRECQTRAILNLERSFSENRPRALVQMATGAGKTFTAITSIYRLLRFAKAKRVLFLVDTKNLGEQAEEEFRKYRPNDDPRLFPELYNVCRLTTSEIPEDTHVCISTIQRMYSILRGEALDEGAELVSLNEVPALKRPVEISYSPKYPIEFFDLIVVDECHRSIYNVWKQVLDYFDAFIVGLTATPDNRTLGFFNGNLVSEYTHEQAVLDNVNVGGDIFVIETDVTKNGAVIFDRMVERRNRLTRKRRWEESEEDILYAPVQLDRDVVNPSQIRTIVRTFKEKILTEIFPERSEVPKTLIFAKTDSHADDIIQIVREEFGEGNEFCKKVTYNSDEDPKSILNEFRNGYYPRIAVTVDMIAVGTDVKAIECLIFMRDVRSPSYYTQMWGRGTRTFSKDELQMVSPSASENKSRYVLIDAVGVTTSLKSANRPLDRKPTVSLQDLMMSVVMGTRDEDTLTTLAGRLSRLNAKLVPKEIEQFEEAAEVPLKDVIVGLLNCFDEDVLRERAVLAFDLAGPEDVTSDQISAVQEKEIEEACSVFYSPKVRGFVEDVRRKHDQIIDSTTQDFVLTVEWDPKRREEALGVITSFQEFISANRDEIAALSIIYSQSYQSRHLTFEMVRELTEALLAVSPQLSVSNLWSCYALRDGKEDKRRGVVRQLADIVSLVRYELGQSLELVPFSDAVNRRFMEWTLLKNAGAVHFTDEQMMWLRMIRDHVATSVEVRSDDLELPPFDTKGGLGRFYKVFGSEYTQVLDEMNGALVG